MINYYHSRKLVYHSGVSFCIKQNPIILTGMVPDNTVHLRHTPPSFVTRGSLILDIHVTPYYIHQFLYFFSLFHSTGESATRDNPWGITTRFSGLYHQKWNLALCLSHLSIKGLIQKIMTVDYTVASMGIPYFSLHYLPCQG